MRIRTRILLWTLLFSIGPVAALYLTLGDLLHSTATLIVKDAGDYAQRKSMLLNYAVQDDMEDSLHQTALAVSEVWRRASDDHDGDLDDTMSDVFAVLERTPTTAFVFSEAGELIGASKDHRAMDGIQRLEELNRRLQDQYVTSSCELSADGQLLLLAMPRSRNPLWRSASQKFRDDFTATVRAKVDATIGQLRLLVVSLFVAIGLIALLLSRWLTRNLTSPLDKLAQAMTEFNGVAPVHMAAERRDEIGLLTERFADMTRKLVETRQKLGEQQTALERADQELMELNLNLEQHIADRTAKLSIALERLREVDKNKDDFLSLVSHELKTPLTSISASAEALMVDDLPLTPDGRKRFLRIIRIEAVRLARLINDLLDLTGLESGRLQFHFESVDLIELVRQTCEVQRPAVEKKKLAFELNVEEDVRLREVRLDAGRFVQILTNLLNNAIKFTDRGRISVALSVAHADSEPTIRLVVADTGIGIRTEDAHKVFDRFQQIERLDTHHEGFGLGMPTSKMLAEGMGGNIRFASKPSHGTAFTVQFPLASWEVTGRKKEPENNVNR